MYCIIEFSKRSLIYNVNLKPCTKHATFFHLDDLYYSLTTVQIIYYVPI